MYSTSATVGSVITYRTSEDGPTQKAVVVKITPRRLIKVVTFDGERLKLVPEGVMFNKYSDGVVAQILAKTVTEYIQSLTYKVPAGGIDPSEVEYALELYRQEKRRREKALARRMGTTVTVGIEGGQKTARAKRRVRTQ